MNENRRIWISLLVGIVFALTQPVDVVGQDEASCGVDVGIGLAFYSGEAVRVNGQRGRDPVPTNLHGGLGAACAVAVPLRLGLQLETEGLVGLEEEDTRLFRFLGTVSYRIASRGGSNPVLWLRGVVGYAEGQEREVIGLPVVGENFIDFAGGGLTAGASVRVPFRLSDEFDLYLEGGWRWHRFDRLRTTEVSPSVVNEAAGSEAVHSFPFQAGVTWKL